MIFSTMRDLFS